MVDPNGMEIAFSVDYNGGTIDFVKTDLGYGHKCPRGCCNAYHWIETTSGARHRITSPEGAPVTIVGSLLCPCKDKTCGWHVVITDGVAKDC